MAIAKYVAIFLVLAGLFLVTERGGFLAWTSLIVGGLWLTKMLHFPGAADATLVLASTFMLAIMWAGTSYYVISTWESGEVVELTITADTGSQTVRSWVLDVDDSAIIYYDAEPEFVTTLQSERPVKFKRRGLKRTLVPKTIPVSDFPPEVLTHIFELMDTKYGKRNHATEVYYSMLGRSRDRVAVIVVLAR